MLGCNEDAMTRRVPTIFEVVEQQAQPQAGQHNLKPARKASDRILRRPKPKQQNRRKGG